MKTKYNWCACIARNVMLLVQYMWHYLVMRKAARKAGDISLTQLS